MPSDDAILPTEYGAFDSTAFEDGRQVDAHLVRELVRSTNRLIARPELIMRQCWRAEADNIADDTGVNFGYAGPAGQWDLLTWSPMIIPKRSVDRRAYCRMMVWAPTGSTFNLQIVTNAHPFEAQPDNSAPNIAQVSGNDAYQAVDTNDLIRLGPGEADQFQLWAYGANHGSTSTDYSASATGTVTGIKYTEFDDSTAPFSAGLFDNAINGRILVRFKDANGYQTVNDRRISKIQSSTTLQFYPRLSYEELNALSSVTGGFLSYELYDALEYRIGDIALYSEVRT